MANRHQNPDGTWNGVTFFAEVTGMPEAEIRWHWERIRQLIQVDKLPRAKALEIVKNEAKARPWLSH